MRRSPPITPIPVRHARFTDKSNGPNACWPWTGGLNAKGYGMMGPWLAHRVSYKIAKGIIPAGMYVLHSCDNRKCQNPAHLRVGTQADNMRDMHERGRARKAFGSKHRLAKLTEDQVREMRAATENRADLARRFNLNWSTVDSIVSGRTWRHVK